jgi:hypothetical protein
LNVSRLIYRWKPISSCPGTVGNCSTDCPLWSNVVSWGLVITPGSWGNDRRDGWQCRHRPYRIPIRSVRFGGRSAVCGRCA